MREENIGVQLHYYPVHMQPYYRNIGFKRGDFINSENYAKRAISMPIYPGLTQKQQNTVIQTVKGIMNETR